jgi:hypothetical protein
MNTTNKPEHDKNSDESVADEVTARALGWPGWFMSLPGEGSTECH